MTYAGDNLGNIMTMFNYPTDGGYIFIIQDKNGNVIQIHTNIKNYD